jgi:RNA polymerase sigma-70 factor (sigma-E family)
MRAEDEAEFAELVEAVSHKLVRMAYAACGDQQLAQDVVQSGLIAAYRSWRRVRLAASPEAYLRRIVLNELAHTRRRSWWRSTSLRAQVPESSPAPSPENGVIEHAVMWGAISELPPRQRAVVVLRYYEGLSEVEIGEALGIRPGTVKSQAAAALAHLRRSLADDAPVRSAAAVQRGGD